jgi:hypothetical protein
MVNINKLPNVLTNAMQHSPWEAYSSSDSQKFLTYYGNLRFITAITKAQ